MKIFTDGQQVALAVEPSRLLPFNEWTRVIFEPKEARETGHALIAEANKHIPTDGFGPPAQSTTDEHSAVGPLCQRCGIHVTFFWKCDKGHEHPWCPTYEMPKSLVSINDCLIVFNEFNLQLIQGTINASVNRNTLVAAASPMGQRLWKSFLKGKRKGL